MTEIEKSYREPQVNHLCANHALNHLLQEKKFVWIENKPLYVNSSGEELTKSDDLPKKKDTKINLWSFCKTTGVYRFNQLYMQQEEDENYKLQKMDNENAGCTMSGENRGNLPFDWFPKIFNLLDYTHEEFNKYATEKDASVERNPDNNKLKSDKSIKQELITNLNDKKCLGLIVNIGKWHYVSIPKFHNEKCKYTIADSLIGPIYICFDNINNLYNRLKKDQFERGYFVFYKDDTSYKSVAVERMLKLPEEVEEVKEEVEEVKEEEDNAKYDDSKDNDDDLEDTPDNIVWKENKRLIRQIYIDKSITNLLVNYGKNLILFYEKKISDVNELIVRKSSDGKKNFVGDVTIQDEQKKNIPQMLWNDPSTKNMTNSQKLDLIAGYYTEIGNQAEEIMEKDYNDRNRTIKYLLLIKEYESNIQSIKNAINYDTNNIQVIEDDDDDYINNVKKDADNQPDSKKWFRGGKKIMNGGGDNSQLVNLYNLLVEEYKNINNTPINDPELKIYLIQYLDNLQFLIDDPVKFDTIQFKEMCQQFLDRLAFLKNHEDEGQNSLMIGGAQPSPQLLQRFINEPDIFKLHEMIEKEGFDINYIDEKIGQENALINAYNTRILDKIYYLISKGADVNQKVKGGQQMVERQVTVGKPALSFINTLISLGATYRAPYTVDEMLQQNIDRDLANALKQPLLNQDTINNNKQKILQQLNIKKEETIDPRAMATPPLPAAVQAVKNNAKPDPVPAAVQAVKNNAKPDPVPAPVPAVKNNAKPVPPLPDPADPLEAQKKLLQDAKKQRDDNFDELNDKLAKLLKDSIDYADKIEKIKKGETDEPQIYKNNKAAALKFANDHIQAIVDQSKLCVNEFMNQRLELEKEIAKIDILVKKIIQDIQKIESEIIDLDKNNEKLNEENKFLDEGYLEEMNKNYDEDDDRIVGIHLNMVNAGDETPHERFVRKYITTNYVKNNLYEFINQCNLLDSVPSWRAKITTLMVGYLTSYVDDPNENNKHINVIPSYDYFNLVLQGTPGVGKSYSSAIIGKALKWCGFLTIGKMKEIKKPDIVGSYTGQTAPKVYNELTQGLGNVVFIDEAYSIAGAKDENKGTFNEFGQEALDAITDYTSEHIGLLAFIVAGYEYEMQNQFLNVNIGLPRRFPTILTLRRYDMKSFWKILEMPIIKFCPKYQVHHHHHACFELLNIMFNFQWTPNPVLQISKKWPTWWEGYNLKNLIMNLKVNMSSTGKKIKNIPFTKLSNFNEKINDIENINITATLIDVLPLTELIGGNINMETATFVKAYFIYKFCNIRNGDFFRNQADNLTKFGQTILSNKVINPSGKFKSDEDKIINGNRKWIEYIYFNLYFTENPNKKVNNIKFKIVELQQEGEDDEDSEQKGGSKYTRKIIKSKKYTHRNNYKRNKKTIHKYKNKKNRKTIRQRGGKGGKDDKKTVKFDESKNTEHSFDTNENRQKGGSDSKEEISEFVRNNLNGKPDTDAIPRMSRMLADSTISDINVKDSTFNGCTALHYQARYGTAGSVAWLLRQDPPPDINVQNSYYQFTPLMLAVLSNEDPEGKVRLLLDHGANRDLKNKDGHTALDIARMYNKPVSVIDLLENYRPDVSRAAIEARKDAALPAAPTNTPIDTTTVEPTNAAIDEDKRKQEAKAKEEIDKLKSENKNLVFDITNIDFSEFKDTKDIKENIIRNKNNNDQINNRPIDANFGNIFNKFMGKYDIYLNIFNGDGEIKDSEKRNLQIWIYTYLLLACYNTAIIESVKPLTKFSNDSWWFFSADDFNIIANYLNVTEIL